MHVFCFLNNKCEDIATACLMVEVLMEVGVLLGRDLKPSPPIFHSLHPCISPQLATKPCYCYSLNLTFPTLVRHDENGHFLFQQVAIA